LPELDNFTGVKQFLEKFLNPIEEKTAEILRVLLVKLRTNNFLKIHPEQRGFLAVFLIMQMMRTKENRVASKQMSKLLSLALKKRFDEEVIVKSFGKQALTGLNDKEVIELQAKQLLDMEQIQNMASIIDAHIWVIHRAKSGQTFLTSDNPFSKRGHIQHPYRSFTGIASKGIEIVFPISPDFCLCLVERSHFKSNEEKDGRLIELKLDDNMIYYNYHQIKSSTRYLFSNSNDFRFVQQVIQEEPLWKNPLRKRVATSDDTPGDTIE